MIRSFKIFCDLVEKKSFSKAAELNFLTQSAVSQHVKAMEQTFNTRLIERGGRRFRLTKAGEKVYETGRLILGHFDSLERTLRKPTDISGILRVGTIYTVGLHELTSYTDRFLKRYPKVNLQLNYLRASEIREQVLEGRLELGIIAYPKMQTGLRAYVFGKDRLVLLVWKGHPWANHQRISLKELRDQSFVAFAGGIPTRRVIDGILHAHKVRVRIVHEFDNIEVIKRAVEVRAGIAIVPYQTVAQEIRNGTLAALKLSEGPFERPIGIVTRKKIDLTPAAKKFIKLLYPSFA